MSWRPMTPADLSAVNDIATTVHAAYPEDPAVFQERLALYPDGCRVLTHDGTITGYIVSHPWVLGQPPALNTLLGAIPASADTFYIHDIALLGSGRNRDAARSVMRALIALAEQSGFTNLTLVAVNNSTAFWQKLGFRIVDDRTLEKKLQSYDDMARLMRLDLVVAA